MPLWGSACSHSRYKMYGIAVHNIAYRSCTVCPPPILLRLYIADTTPQYIANALK